MAKLPLEKALVFMPELMTCVWNVEFLGKTLKTRVQEVMLPCPSLHMLSRKVPPMAIYLLTEHLNF
jgi:hypothetical protein